jgi:hypothetical protein
MGAGIAVALFIVGLPLGTLTAALGVKLAKLTPGQPKATIETAIRHYVAAGAITLVLGLVAVVVLAAICWK